MSFKGLSAFVKHLEEEEDLIRINCRVDTDLEITEIADRMVKSGGKALLFEDTGTSFPLLINAFASDSRIAAAIGRKSPEDAGDEILSLFEMVGKKGNLLGRLRDLPKMSRLLSIAPGRRMGKGTCQQVVIEKPDLSILPVIKCWPYDGGKFITLPLVHTKHAVTGQTNLGMYRMQIMGRDITGMHWHRHKTGARHYQSWKDEKKIMPVTVTLGGDPVYTYAATAPMPENIDEYLLAGFLRKKRVALVKCLTNDLWIPEDSDIVIEGYVDPSEGLVTEGPFGDHTGFYSLADLYPVFHVTCITHRKDAVYPATIVGVPPMEDAWFGKATEEIFLAPVKLALAPEIRDLHMPTAGVAHNIVLVSADKNYPGQGMKILSTLFGAGQMMFSKYIGVFRGETNLRDYDAIISQLLDNVRFNKDLLLTKGPLDILDHASDTYSLGGKLGIDATVKTWEEGDAENESAGTLRIEMSVFENKVITGTRLIDKYRTPVILLAVRKPAEGLFMKELVDSISGKINDEKMLVIAFDHGADLQDDYMIAWLASGNSDPGRDLYRLGARGLFVDATSKFGSLPPFPRKWPNIVCSDTTTIALVDRRWNDYKTGDFITSPSLKLLSLLHQGSSSAER